MLRLLSVSLLAIVLTGCASSAKVDNMLVNDVGADANRFDSALQNNLQVDQVEGGDKTNPLWTSEIDGADFQAALQQSLDKVGLLGQEGKATYVLDAKLVRVDQPLFGFDFTVTTHVEYSLIEKASGQVVWKDVVNAPFTAGVGDAFYGVKRLRLANEGSARENIKQMLVRMSSLKLGNGQVSLQN